MNDNDNLPSLEEDLKAYVRIQSKIVRLDIADKLSSFGSHLTSQTILAICLVLALLFLGIGASIYFASLTRNASLGFCIMAGLFVLLFSIIYFFRNRFIREPIKNKLVTQLLNEDHQFLKK
jgi:hypothetical protein